MRIAYIVEPRKVIGGGVRAAMNLAKTMSSRADVDCCIFGTYKGSVVDQDVCFEDVSTLNPIGLNYWRSFHRFVKKQKPDIFHCLGLYTALGCIIYRMLTGRKFKIVCTVHRVTLNMRYRRLMKYAVRFIANRIDYATFLTQYQQKHYFEKVGYTPSQFKIIPNVIFVNKVSDEEKVALHQHLTKELKAEVLLSYVGRVIPSKNLEDFIRIIGILKQRGCSVAGIIVGGYDEAYYEKLKNLINELDVADKIKFEGYKNNPELYIASSDYILFTTKHGEALPNLLVESFSLGKITLSSDIPQMQDLIDNGVNGFTLPLSSLDLFAEKIEWMIRNAPKRLELESSAQHTYDTEYSPEIVSSKYMDIYQFI